MKKGDIPKIHTLPGKQVVPKKTVTPKKSTGLPPSSGKGNRYFVLSFFLFAFILYGNTMLNKYAVDDNYVTNNQQVQKGFKAIPEIFMTRYVNQQGNLGSTSSDYRPIPKTTFAIEHQFWGSKPGVSHGINILIYWALSVLLFFILKRVLKNFNILFPFLVTLLFMAHPVHTEVVASLKNRDEMFAFICGLGSIWFMLEYADKRNARYFFYTALLIFTGYLCKTAILPFLVLIPLVLWFFTDLPPKEIYILSEAGLGKIFTDELRFFDSSMAAGVHV